MNLIVAMGKNRVIGKNNDLPWKLPEDLKRVKKITLGGSLIMGRKNFESIGRALPERRNIVLTRDKAFHFEGIEVAHSKVEAIEKAENTEVFIFGGEEIYRIFMNDADTIFMTYIDEEFEGDTYFPGFDHSQWELVQNEKGEKNEKNPYDYWFKVYKRAAFD